jgi:hypothetical protein
MRYLPQQAHALEQTFSYRTEREAREREATRSALDGFTIALSREASTPAVEIAQTLGARLGWPVWNHELPERIARELHVPVAVIDEIDEKRQSWLVECIEAFVSTPELSESRYVRHLIGVIRSLGERGGCIIVGRGAAHVLPPASTLRVRLVGATEDRIGAFARRFHLDYQTATRKLEEINHERNRFIREHFQSDPAKARNYDLVLNTSQWSPVDCADLIEQALHHKSAAHARA